MLSLELQYLIRYSNSNLFFNIKLSSHEDHTKYEFQKIHRTHEELELWATGRKISRYFHITYFVHKL